MKPTALLLHSGGMSSRQWRKLADALAPSHRVLAPDFLGCGENPPWPDGAPFHFQADVDALLPLLDAPVDVVGHSYGGLVALTLARQQPARVRSVAVYDPVAFGVLHDAGETTGLDPTAFLDDELGGQEAWFEPFVDWWNGPGTWRALPEPSRAAFLRVGRKVFLEVRSLLLDRTPRAAYRAITAPTLLLSGEHTPPPARRVAQLLAEAIPTATHRTIGGAGHMGPITHAREVNALVLEHVTHLGRSASARSEAPH